MLFAVGIEVDGELAYQFIYDFIAGGPGLQEYAYNRLLFLFIFMHYLHFAVEELPIHTVFTFELESDFFGCVLELLEVVIHVLQLAESAHCDGFLPVLLGDEVASLFVLPLCFGILELLGLLGL